jgi:phosphatidylglycerophosphate synthase
MAVGFAALATLLAALGTMAGLGRAGWAVGLGCGALLTVTLARALSRAARDTFGPADLVTLSRGMLTCGAAALTVESLLGRHVTPAILVLTVPALLSDAVDGRVARRTGTVTAFGARFDGEVDAFLILVLSVVVAPSIGWWVLAAGLARYLFAVGALVLPWLRRRLEFRYWRKVVTASVGIALTVAAADVLPHRVAVTVVGVALALLAESFGRDVWWLWRRRPRPDPRGGGTRRPRTGVAVVSTVLALALVWCALVAPTRPDRVTPVAFLRLPLEIVLVAGLALVVSARWRRTFANLVGTLLGVLILLKILDLGAFTVLDRPFDVVTDPSQLGSGVAFVRDSMGPWAATGSVVGAVLLVGTVGVCLPWAVGRLTNLLARHRRGAIRAVSLLAAVWMTAAVSGLQVAPGERVAAADAGRFMADKARATAAAYRDRERFDQAVAADRIPDPTSGELSWLRGKDVVLAFVESYGRVAIEGPDSAPVRRLLDAGTARLLASGYTARSAFLTSPTFGGRSWLAHATLQSGLSVDDQGEYDRLLASHRTTLTSVFVRAGWRTVAVMPSTRGRWPEGQHFYHFDEIYDRSSLGYAGPTFGFSAMPDQYALSAFERLELARPHRAPVMAQIELTSSHAPWAPLPTAVDWAALGDGSIFHGIRAHAVTAAELWSDRADVPAAYRTSIAYSLTSLLSFVERHADDDLVLVLLGDHQPSTIVSGFGGSRDVPVTVIAHDPRVIQQVSGWGWQDGLRPDERAPVWPMDAFRDRFLAAYSAPAPSGGTQDQP